jgi:hypothetical protein
MGKRKNKLKAGKKIYNKYTNVGYHIMVDREADREGMLSGGLIVSYESLKLDYTRRKR